MILFLAFLTWRQQQDKNALSAAKSTEGSALAELSVWKETAERLSKENRDLIAAKSALEAKTDLNPILARIAQWENESRTHFLKAMERLDVVHKEQTDAMREVIEALSRLAPRVD